MKTNIIYCGECAEMMQKHIPDNSIDLTVTSPPYDPVGYDNEGNLVTYSDNGLRDYQGYTWDFASIAGQLWRVTKPGGVVVWVVADATVDGSETGSSFRQALGFMGLGFKLHDTMIYQFAGTGAKGSTKSYWQGFEYMFILSKGKPQKINLIADHENIKAGSRNGQTGKYSNGTRKERGIRITPKFSVRNNVWVFGGTVGDKTNHTAQFPEALARDHIISWSNPGDIILDPMCGSGTTLKMAVEQGRQYIGIDISQEYCDLSRQRVTCARIPLPGLTTPPAQQAEAEQLELE